MTIKTYVKSGITWNPSKDIYVKDDGSWRTIKKAWIKSADVWRLIHNKQVQLSITTSGRNVNLRTVLDTFLGYPQNAPMDVIITVNPGVVIGSNSISSPAMETGIFFPGTTVTLINYGVIAGAGGRGGGCFPVLGPTGGGPALNAASWPLTVYNHGVIGGGGGGGGLGDCDGNNSPSGGGGAGDIPGTTGIGWGGACTPGPATLFYGGVGNWCWYGGNLGQYGVYHYGFASHTPPGAYIQGNTNVTWGYLGDVRGLAT